MTANLNLWLKCPKSNPHARLRLFCFPYAGAGASIFLSWPEYLPSDIEVCAVQLPGREGRLSEPLFTNLSHLSETLARVLLPYLDRPFAFFGHSLGALIVFELTRQLRRQRAPTPIHLFISGRRAPQIPDLDPPFYQLPDAEFIKKLRYYNGTPKALLQNPELISLFLPIIRADLALNENYLYTPDRPLECSLSAFGGLQDNIVSQNHLLSWRDHTSSDFILRMFPGDHFFLKQFRNPLLDAISQDLICNNLR